jgi:class 3 adenylate cyclase
MTVEGLDFDNEIRVNQSVEIVRGLPVLALGNPAGVVLIALSSWRELVSSYAIVPAVFLVILMVPLATSYLRMRRLDRPKTVSKRRIRTIVLHSFLVGLTWAAILGMLLPALDAFGQMVAMLVVVFMWYGSVAIVGCVPKAVTGFVLPAWIAAYAALMYDGAIDRFLVTMILAVGAIAIYQTGRPLWLSFRSRVAMEHELERNSAFQAALSGKIAKYISPQVYDSIFHGKQDVSTASQRKKLTVFFSDIERFTEITDRMESEDLTDLLNHYLTEMSKIALEHGATIDKYVGDAIVIFFGDPESKGVQEDALACVKMAIAMRERMVQLEHIWREQGIEKPLRCRMGVHTDFCTVGNFGSEDRMDYTIIGGGVNTASRLESLAAPGEILISYETYAHVQDQVVCEERGEVDVKGMAYPVAIYRVLDETATAGARRLRYREQMAGVTLDINLATMNDESRIQAKEVLHRALDRLDNVDAPREQAAE